MASEFLYITDTHIGNDGSGWGHHPLRPDLIPRLINALEKWIEKHPVNMVLHGGDMIDSGAAEQQMQAKEMWAQLSVPVRLCLGNHDVACEGAYNNWLSNVPELFLEGKADYFVECGKADVYVLACSWLNEDGELSQWWNRDVQDRAGILPEQLAWLDGALSNRSDRPAIVALHCPLDPLPTALTGACEPIHVPQRSYVESMLSVINAHGNVKLVLGGHCHATCVTSYDERTHLTTAAFSEPPFQIRRISIDDEVIKVRTFSPVDHRQLEVTFRAERAWSAGRAGDTSVDIPYGDATA